MLSIIYLKDFNLNAKPNRAAYCDELLAIVSLV